MERVIEVFVELDGTSQFVGRLWSRSLKGRESASFEYDKKWIASDARFALEPLRPTGQYLDIFSGAELDRLNRHVVAATFEAKT